MLETRCLELLMKMAEPIEPLLGHACCTMTYTPKGVNAVIHYKGIDYALTITPKGAHNV